MRVRKISDIGICLFDLFVICTIPAILAILISFFKALQQDTIIILFSAYVLIAITLIVKNLVSYSESKRKAYILSIFIFLTIGFGSCFFSGLLLSGMRIAG